MSRFVCVRIRRIGWIGRRRSWLARRIVRRGSTAWANPRLLPCEICKVCEGLPFHGEEPSL